MSTANLTTTNVPSLQTEGAVTSPKPSSIYRALPKLYSPPPAPAVVSTPAPIAATATMTAGVKRTAADAFTTPVATTTTKTTTKKPAKVALKDKPHVLIWVCHHGPGQNGKWTQKNLKIVGVYPNKSRAEQRKMEICNQHQQCGYGDIMVGGSWDDEIDLIIRPTEECELE